LLSGLILVVRPRAAQVIRAFPAREEGV